MTGAFCGARSRVHNFNFQNSQQRHCSNSRYAFATPRRDAPESCIYLSPYGGRGECRVPAAPAASCALCIGRSTRVTTSTPGSPGIPARNGFNGLCRALPGDQALLPPSSRGYLTCPRPVGPTCLPQDLTPASGRQDHTILPSAKSVSRQRAIDRSQVPKNSPCDPIARETLPRPPHPVPYVRDDRETPLCVGRDAKSSRGDLGCVKTKIFLQMGLDTPVNKPPDGQIT
jgi:hypothetical protein